MSCEHDRGSEEECQELSRARQVHPWDEGYEKVERTVTSSWNLTSNFHPRGRRGEPRISKSMIHLGKQVQPYS